MPTRKLLAAAALIAVCSAAGCTSSGSPAASDTTGSTPVSSSSTPTAGPTVPVSGSATTTAPTSARTTLATFSTVGGRATTMRFDPSFVRALFTRAITTKASGDAKLTPRGDGSQVVLPITGGHVTLKSGSAAATSTGVVSHSGSGLRLGNPDGVSVRIDAFVLTLGAHSSISAQLETLVNGATGPAKPVTLFTLKPTSRTAASLAHGVGTLSGFRLYLTAAAGTALDAALETTAFRGMPGELYAGTVSVAVTKR